MRLCVCLSVCPWLPQHEVIFVNTRLNKAYYESYSYSVVCKAIYAGWPIPTYQTIRCHNLKYHSKNRHNP